jgi:hypothetical protein
MGAGEAREGEAGRSSRSWDTGKWMPAKGSTSASGRRLEEDAWLSAVVVVSDALVVEVVLCAVVVLDSLSWRAGGGARVADVLLELLEVESPPAAP